MLNTRPYYRKHTIRELAQTFDTQLNIFLPVAVLPNEAVAFKKYVVAEQKNKDWSVISIETKNVLDSFFLKSCAVLAAKARFHSNFSLLSEVKRLDLQYLSHLNNISVLEHSISKKENLDRLDILEIKLEHSRSQVELYQNKLRRLFRAHFV